VQTRALCGSVARVNGLNVVVTGATGGLGAGVVELLLARGAELHLPILEAALPERLAWRGHPRVHATTLASLEDEARVAAFYESLPVWASIHLVGGFAMSPIEATTLSAFELQWRTNVATCFVTCREAVRGMRRGGRGGRIVNVAARPAIAPTAGMIAYATAKAGVAALTQHLAAEVVADDILVNAVLPSIIDTPMNRKGMPDADHARWPKPAQLAETIAFLASPTNALTSGALVPVFGRA
jgi:NAD(P)-dependent dehydrogenase (short-subunit alcohol dehydrogenase family)